MTPQTPRPYQLEAIEAVERGWLMGEVPLIFMATGGGKTTVMAELLRRNLHADSQRALVFVHRKEIVEQIHERIANQFAELKESYFTQTGIAPGLGIVQGDMNAINARIVVASAGSLHPKRLPKLLAHGRFDYVVHDEGHHYAPGNSFDTLFDALRKDNPAVKLVGVTATPKRHDKKSLGHLYTKIVYEWSILDGIKGGYLTPVQQIVVSTQIGDMFNPQHVSILKTENWCELAIDAYQRYLAIDERPTIAFWSTVEMSRKFTDELVKIGVRAAHVDDSTDKNVRNRIKLQYAAGEIDVLSNVNVFTEGLDVPRTSGIFLGRLNIRSQVLITQMIGRGLRPSPGKVDCLVVNLSANDTKALDLGTLVGKMVKCEQCCKDYPKGLFKCPYCGAFPAPVEKEDRGESFAQVKEELFRGRDLRDEIVSIFAHLSAHWQRDPEGWCSCGLGRGRGSFVIAPPTYATNFDRVRERLADATYLLKSYEEKCDPRTPILIAQIGRLEREKSRIERYVLYRVEKEGKVTQVKDADSFAALISEADGLALGLVDNRRAIARDADWRMQFASPQQIDLLKRMKIPYDRTTLTKGIASELLDHALSVPKVKAFIAGDLLPERKVKQVLYELEKV